MARHYSFITTSLTGYSFIITSLTEMCRTA